MFAPEEKNIIVTYHYVQDPDPKWGGIYPCSRSQFEEQIKFLSKEYEIVSIEDVYKNAQEKKNKKKCAVTFDDGLKCQITNALPILRKYQVPATFFIITKTFSGNIPLTHKIHILLSLYSVEEIIHLFNVFLERNYQEYLNTYRIPLEERLVNTRKQFDNIPTANFKETMALLPSNISEQFTEDMFRKSNFEVLQGGDIQKDFFMNEGDIRNLTQNGFFIGSHAHTHNLLEYKKGKDLRYDICESKRQFKKIFDFSPTLFCYPQGSFSGVAIDELKKAGFSHSVTTERRGIRSDENPYVLPRYDTNDIRDYLAKND